VAHGEKFALRKYLRINDYWTRGDGAEPGYEAPKIILR
jgi:hypothetical protein